MSMQCSACSTNSQTGVKTCTTTTVYWKLFYAGCKTGINCQSGSSNNSSAYVAASVVCSQSL